MSDPITAISRAAAGGAAGPDLPKLSKQDDPATIRAKAEAFESAFITEMLKHSGVGKVPDAFGGGVGEEAFSDFLTRAYAEEIAETRSIGIADHVEAALNRKIGR